MTDSKGNQVVTSPTGGTKATTPDGKAVEINKDGTVTVPGVGTFPSH